MPPRSPTSTLFPYTTLFRSVKRHGMSATTALVPQQAFLFDDTVRGNVTLGLDAPDEDVNRNRSEEHTSELQSRENLVCRLLLEKKKKHIIEKLCKGCDYDST